MNNKIFQHIIFSSLCLAATCAVTSCDNVDVEDRLIPVERPDVARRVLIQEFTGINCVNCPTGAAKIHSIQEAYPESAIVVGMHPGGTGFSGPIGTFNLNSDLARVYYDYFKPDGFPAAMFDGSSPQINVEMWTKSFMDAVAIPAKGEIELETQYDPATRNLTVKYEVEMNEAYSQSLNINLWIVEDGIVGPQKSGSTIIFEYVHNHVLRTSMNGDWGTKLADSFTIGQRFNGESSITLDAGWVAENCKVVGFLQNGARRVEQAVEADVIPAEE